MESNGKTQRRKSVAKRVTVRFQTALGLHSNSDDGPPSGGAAAILLLDFQNEFAKKGGKLHDDVADTMSTLGVLENVTELIDYARKMNAMIIYSPVVMKESGTFTNSSTHSSSSSTIPDYSEQYGLFTENTWNCEIVHEVEPRNDDIVLQDRCDYSAFEGTKLISELRDNNIKHLFVA